MNSFRISTRNLFFHRGLLLLAAMVLMQGSLLTVQAKPGAPATKTGATDKPADKAPDKTDKPGEKTAAAGKEATKPTPEPVIENVVPCSPEDLVAKPRDFLGKNVKFNANFFAFSNLALDYKPAYRAAKTHLSFLILRPKSHVPLSELKLAMMIPKEKDPDTQLLATLKDGDSLEITGKVFSTALDDPWVEVLRMKKLNAASDDKDKKADASAADGSKAKAAVDSKQDKAPAGKTETVKPKSAPKN